MSPEHSDGLLLARMIASDAARRAGASAVEPAHLLMGLCAVCDVDASDNEPSAGAVEPDAVDLRRRFGFAQIDPAALRRRIRRRLGRQSGPVESPDGELEDLLHRSPSSRVAFERAEALASASRAHRTTATHLLRALLEDPIPEWAVPAADLGVEDMLAVCFPVEEPTLGLDEDPPHVELEILTGASAGRRLVTGEPAAWLVGRSSACHLRIPKSDDPSVSRHHALVDVSPPLARVRDLGSSNGTSVGGVALAAGPPEDPTTWHDLADGDVVTVGATTLRVGVRGHRRCADCDAVLPEPGDGRDRCAECRARPDPGPAPPVRPTRLLVPCAVCRDTAEPLDPLRSPSPDPDLCRACRADPERIVDVLASRVTDEGTEVPHVFGGYTLVELLGTGGMGSVYLARDEYTGDLVSLKTMLPRIRGIENVAEQFRREAGNARQLRHRNVVRQREHGQWYGVYYLVTDYCESGDLNAVLRRAGGRLPVRRSVHIVRQMLDGLEYAHHVEILVRSPDGRVHTERGLVHRDVSPANVLFAGGMVKIADFGLSKAFAHAGLSGITRTGTAAGKPRFIPRSQLTGYRDAGPEVDVWAAAACLYFLLTGHAPRDFHGRLDEFQVVLERDPVPIRERDRSVPRDLADVLDRALREEPAMAFMEAAPLREALLAATPL